MSGTIKGIISDSDNIFSWHKSNKGYFQNFSWFQFYVYKLCMIMCIGIACTVLSLVDETLCMKWLSFHKEIVSA